MPQRGKIVADEKEKKSEASHISIECVENGYKICCTYENADKSLAARAGWVPCGPCECKTYVEKTAESVLKRLKEIL
jgi:hypothetical protein